MANTVYFICEWNDTPIARMCIDPIENGYEIGSVKWRNQPVTVKIVSSEPVELRQKVEKFPPDLYALLKSNLQKQIRRGKVLAVATAARLWELGQFELLRRLIVIAAEDSEISTETAVVMWLMVAKNKGLVLSSDHRSWILGYVYSLVKHNTCRRLSSNLIDGDGDLQLMNVLANDHDQSAQLAGILFRTAYGGLKGDLPMISRCIDWCLRTNEKLPSLNVTRWDQDLPKLLINRAAIDHHIYVSLPEELSRMHLGYTKEYIATVIWECSSGYNVRYKSIVNTEYSSCWEVIQGDFKKLTRAYLSKIITKFDGL